MQLGMFVGPECLILPVKRAYIILNISDRVQAYSSNIILFWLIGIVSNRDMRALLHPSECVQRFHGNNNELHNFI